MWEWAIWGALAVAVAALAGSLTFAAVRALEAWRALKRLRRHVAKALERLSDAGERAAQAAAAAADTTELERSLERLGRSLARLAVLREALDEAQTTLARLLPVPLRK
ncbi:MAG: hypothetical protein IRZ20_01145 [Thermoleophilia bacterium]|nr:hypothetical protein [Thermoleophilia bacterium]